MYDPVRASELVCPRKVCAAFSGAIEFDAPLVNRAFTADPSARVINGYLYIVTSHDTDERNQWPPRDEAQFQMRDYRLLRAASPDSPVEDLGTLLTLNQIKWAAGQMWAPELAIGRDGRFHLLFAAKDRYGAFRLGAAHADHPEGPYLPDDVPIPGAFSIDPSVMIDHPKGAAYVYWGGLQGGQLERWEEIAASRASGEHGITSGDVYREGHADGSAHGPLAARLDSGMSRLESDVVELQVLDENGKRIKAADRDRCFFEGVQVYQVRD